MFTSWSDVSTPALLSIASVLISPPWSAYSTRPSWVNPRLPPSATARQRSSLPLIRSASLVLSPTSVGRSCGCLHVGSDAAVVEQVDGRTEDRADQIGRRARRDRPVDAERGAHLVGERDRLGGAGIHAAARRDQLGVVLGPRRAGHAEQPLALLPRAFGVGVGIEEHVPVVERRDQSDVVREQHAVAEHVARHVTDADHGEVVGVGIDPEMAKVAAHRLPRSAGGDAHLLVVVARRPTRRERVTEPEAAATRDLVGGVGERRRALVGRDHEVGVVAVEAHDAGRRLDDRLAGGGAHTVVGDVEQRRDEQPVAGLHLGAQRGPGRRAAASPRTRPSRPTARSRRS